MRRHRKVLLGVVAGAAAMGGGCHTAAPAQAETLAEAEAPVVTATPGPAPDAGPKPPCTWKVGNTKQPPCVD